MKKLTILLLLLTFVEANVVFEPFASLGKSSADFSWRVSKDNQSSDLKWQDLSVERRDFGIRVNHANLEASLTISRGKSSGGAVVDSDYNPDLYKKSVSKADGTTLGSELFMVGYKMGSISTIELAVFGAYLSTSDKYMLKNGEMVVPNYEKIEGLNSSYHAKTNGFGGMARAKYSPFEYYGNISFGYGKFVLDYQAEGDWNLRADLRGFEHKGTAHREIYWGEIEANLPRKIVLFVRMSEESYSVNGGEDRVVFADGTTARQNLKSVSFREKNITVGIKGKF